MATPWVSAQLHSRLMVHISPLALMTNPSRYGMSQWGCNCRCSRVTLILLLPLHFHLTILGSFLAPGTSQYGCGMYQKASSCRCPLVNSTMSPPSRFQPMAWISYQAPLTNLYIYGVCHGRCGRDRRASRRFSEMYAYGRRLDPTSLYPLFYFIITFLL